jgi:DHA1 family inner membrane transport protein
LGKFSRSEIGLLAILTSVQFTHIVDFMLMMPLGPQLMRLMAIDPSEFSLLVSAYTFAAALAIVWKFEHGYWLRGFQP